MIIRKKVWSEWFERIRSGKKTFELRLADFDINEGDSLVFEEWDKGKKEYTGRSIEVVATTIFKTKDQSFFSPEDVEKYGYQIIGFEVKKRRDGKSRSKYPQKKRNIKKSLTRM